MRPRGLDKRFLDEMREGLARGWATGHEGWESRSWGVTSSWMFDRLMQEVIELAVAMRTKEKHTTVPREAADVANFAMFIAGMYR